MTHKRLNLSDEDYQAHKKKQGWASKILRKAKMRGEIPLADACELCGEAARETPFLEQCRLVAHHWNGYDNPLDIWWICSKCNNILIGPELHNGSVSKEEARAIIANSKKPA